MRALKMLSGDPRPIENPVWLDRVVDVLSDGPGIWYPLVKRGTYVQEGMKIGFVTDYFGKVILEARAPVSGVILHINAVPSLKKGDNIADIAPLPPTPPKSSGLVARSRLEAPKDSLFVTARIPTADLLYQRQEIADAQWSGILPFWTRMTSTASK